MFYIKIAIAFIFFLMICYIFSLRSKLQKKQIIDDHELENYQKEIDILYSQKNREEKALEDIQKRINQSLIQANQLDETLANTAAKQIEIVEAEVAAKTEEAYINLNNINASIESRAKDYENVIAPMELLEKEKQQKLFYSIHLTNDDKCDIIYLLKEVAPHINHKDILSKLIWQEFIKNPLEETLKRVGVTQGAGIYKLTNMKNGMCYVGKSTNVKKRIQDHFKSVVGITSISDQRVHHAIFDEGIDNWTIEQVCECEKEELNEKEKFYIEFFKATEYGYNLKVGG